MSIELSSEPLQMAIELSTELFRISVELSSEPFRISHRRFTATHIKQLT